MQLYEFRQKSKFIFIVTAIVIAIASVWITNVLVGSLANEERKNIEFWAESVRLLALQVSDPDQNMEVFNAYDKLLLRIVQGNTAIPVILADQDDEILMHLNIDLPESDGDLFLKEKLRSFRQKNEPIVLVLKEGENQYVYYDDSKILKRLLVFPYAQLLVVFIFIVISFLALSSSKKAEQNKVWVGLSKETAHQLGTPISSLMAWMELLREQIKDASIVDEIDKDIDRLNMIAERFSKIGSNPDLQPMEVNGAIEKSVEYMGRRISSKVQITCAYLGAPVYALMNEALFVWVVENLFKNAVDAMDGVGKVDVAIHEMRHVVRIDVSDTGRGIPKSKYATVFHPGYTTKERGWGLGLSLVKRIVESYSGGRIFVLRSEPNKGTTFRIELKKKKE